MSIIRTGRVLFPLLDKTRASILRIIKLPLFPEPVGYALQWLFRSNKVINEVKVDGFTYLKDAANKGTDRLQLRGVKNILDGIDGIIVIGDVGNTQYASVWVRQVVDNQRFFSLANSLATAVSVSGAVLTFGASLTVNNIFVDGISKNASEAGIILNDNLLHHLYIDFDQIAASNLVLGIDIATYGNIELFDFRVGDAIEPIADVNLIYDNPNALFGTETGIWHLDENSGTDNYDSSGNGNNGVASGGVTWSSQNIVSFQNYYGYNKPASVYIPAKLDTISPTVDVLDNALTYSGKAPKDGRLVESHCGTLDGVDEEINYGDCGSATKVSLYVRSVVDNQYILSLDNAATKVVYVSAGVLTFGASLSASNITIDEVSKNATEAGALLNDNLIHLLEFDLVSVTCTDVRLGRSAANYGNIEVSKFELDELLAPIAEGAGLVSFDISNNTNHGTIVATEAPFWAATQNQYHYNLLNGFNIQDFNSKITAVEPETNKHKGFMGLSNVDGRLWSLFRSGTGHLSFDGEINAIYSDDNGQTWSEKQFVYNGDEIFDDDPTIRANEPRALADIRDVHHINTGDGYLTVILFISIGYEDLEEASTRTLVSPFIITKSIKIPITGNTLDFSNLTIWRVDPSDSRPNGTHPFLYNNVLYTATYGEEVELYKSVSHGLLNDWTFVGDVFPFTGTELPHPDSANECAITVVSDVFYAIGRPLDPVSNPLGVLSKSVDFGVTWVVDIDPPVRLDGIFSLTLPNDKILAAGRYGFTTSYYILNTNFSVHKAITLISDAGYKADRGYPAILKVNENYIFIYHEGEKTVNPNTPDHADAGMFLTYIDESIIEA